jgi:FkbM family methyltransferase
VKQALVATGLRNTAAKLYHNLLLLLTDDYHQEQIGEATATFLVTNRHEARHFPIKEEMPILSDFLDNINPDDVVFDIGAHIGIYSCLVDDVLTSGSVLAFEPHPNNARRLRENATNNNAVIDVYEHALSNEHGVISLCIDNGSAGGIGHLSARDKSEESISVETFPGKEFLNEYDVPSPDILKIDVEGAEVDVLGGFRDILDDCRLLYIEVHPDWMVNYDSSPQELKEILSSHGFSLEKIHEAENRYFLKAHRE